MNKFLKKFLSFLALTLVLSLSVGNTFVNVQNVRAGGNGDSCGDEKTFTVDEDSDSFFSFDESDDRVQVDFNGNSDNRNQVVVTADTGYKLISVEWDNENNGNSFASVSVTNPTTTINTSGDSNSTRIDQLKVKVKKDCVDPNVCPEGNGWVKDESSSGGFSYTAPSGYIIDQVCAKGGNTQNSNGYLFTTSNNGVGHSCPGEGTDTITVSGIGNQTSSVTRQGNDCADISHASFHSVPVVIDVCTNIPNAQASLPSGHYFASAGICLPQTGVCTDDSATNYDSNVTSNEYSDNSVCTYPEVTPTDYCELLPGVQTEQDSCEVEIPVCEEGQELVIGENGLQVCIECDGPGTCEVGTGPVDTNDPTPTPTETPTPTPSEAPSNNNNNSSNNSTGGTGSPAVQASVLEATTMANTGNFAQTLANTALTFGLMLISLSGLGYAKKHGKKSN